MLVFDTPEGHIGGFTKGSRPTGRACPQVSYRVDDLDDTLATAQKLGAQVVDEKRPVPGVGFYAGVVAPDGNEFGLVEFSERG